jgi:hypothetical protein
MRTGTKSDGQDLFHFSGSKETGAGTIATDPAMPHVRGPNNVRVICVFACVSTSWSTSKTQTHVQPVANSQALCRHRPLEMGLVAGSTNFPIGSPHTTLALDAPLWSAHEELHCGAVWRNLTRLPSRHAITVCRQTAQLQHLTRHKRKKQWLFAGCWLLALVNSTKHQSQPIPICSLGSF